MGPPNDSLKSVKGDCYRHLQKYLLVRKKNKTIPRNCFSHSFSQLTCVKVNSFREINHLCQHLSPASDLNVALKLSFPAQHHYVSESNHGALYLASVPSSLCTGSAALDLLEVSELCPLQYQ